MNFSTIIAALEAVATLPQWPNVSTYPVEFKGQVSGQEYFKFELVFLTAERHGYAGGQTRVTGQVIIQIYYSDSKSKRYAASLAEGVTPLLEDKVFLSGKLQTFTPALSYLGLDPKNSALKRADLTVPFTYIGE